MMSTSSSEEEIVQTMQNLLNEINHIKNEVETCIKTLKRIDNAATNHDRLVKGRIQIKNLNDRIIDLRKQMNSMTKESDPTWPIKTFDKSKQNALNTLSDLSNQLNQFDKYLEEATESISIASNTSIESNKPKGLGASVRKLSFENSKKTTSLSNSDEYDVVHKPSEPQRTSRITKNNESSSDESDETDDEDDMNNQHQLLSELQNNKVINDDLNDSYKHETPPRITNQTSTVKVHSTPKTKQTTNETVSALVFHKRTPSPQQRTATPTTEDDSYFEDSDEEVNELKRLHESTDDQRSVHEYDETEDNESTAITKHVQELRARQYPPGTQFRVLYNLNGLQSGDLSINKDEIIILIQQQPDDWWLFENPQTREQGMVPINHIEFHPKSTDQKLRYHINPVTSASTLVNVFKTNNYIPSGYIPSDLAPLTQQMKYKLSNILIPKMAESNFTFKDLYWRYDTEQISIQEVQCQKILSIKKCSKIPKIKGEQVDVLNRCVRVCLYNGLEIISNIHSIRARLSSKSKENDVTENWYFVPNDDNTFIDEQSEFLIRSDEYHSSKNLYLLIELSQLCQSKLTQEKCEIGCGWIILSLDDNQLSGVSETKSFNELLQGGHYYQTNIPLNSQYINLQDHGIGGSIDRYKKARIRFSIQSRETHIDVLYDNLPLTSMIIPINLIQTIVFYRNELAYQLQKRFYPGGLSTTPIDSIFLSTFYETLEQPDLIYTLRRLYHQKKRLTIREQREEFIKIYELSIYPLLFYRSLPPYDFHDISSINQRRKLISQIITRQLATKVNNHPDILSILLDKDLTDKWTPFTTDEICFSLQKYTHDFTSNDLVP